MKWMRLLVLGLSFGTAMAQSKLGTKKDISLPEASSVSAGPGWAAMVQMVLAVAVVIGLLKFLLPKLAPMMTKKLSSSTAISIKVIESIPFSGGNLSIVETTGRRLLVGSSGQNIALVADLTEKIETKPDAPAFFELLDAARNRIDTPAPARAAVQMADPDEIEDQLDRLNRLLGKANRA